MTLNLVTLCDVCDALCDVFLLINRFFAIEAKMAQQKTGLKCCSRYLIILLFVILGLFCSTSNGKRQQIEEIAKRQLDTLLQTEDYLAVFWRKFRYDLVKRG